MGKDRANTYCDLCKKIHRKGKCTELSPKEISNVTPNTAMALMNRAARRMYFNRDKINDIKDTIESDVIKEGDEVGSGGNNKENK